MQPSFFIKMFIGAQVKSHPETFPSIGSYPIIPGTDLIIANIFITGADKIDVYW